MATASLGAAILQVHRLFDEGSVAGLSDGQLLDRFVGDRDERAFETLVGRHGPMVLATCRTVLDDRHAAEDAFQSAFALLVRRASTLRNADALGGWLHRVAYREAVRLGTEAARRRALERTAPPPTRSEDDNPDDLRAIVHAELDRLPESLRLPVVLCDLEGLTKARAAEDLGWTEATVRGRLERARRLLRTRLTRRGLGASAAWLVGSIGGEASASVSPGLATSAIRAASAVIPAASRVAVRVKVATTVLTIGLVGLAGLGRPGDEVRVASPPPPVREAVEVQAQVEDADPAKPVEVVGRVIDPSGKPVAGAKVRLQVSPTSLPREPEPTTTTDANGRFSVEGPRWAFPVKVPWWGPQVVASAPGFGPGLAFVGHVTETPGEVTVQLVADDLPIEGRILDLEGRPVAGASIRVSDVYLSTGVDLSKWLDHVRQFGVRGPWEGLNTRDLDAIPDLPEAATTAGPDGRFRVVGIGRERIAALLISGPGIATELVHAMTRSGPPIKTADRGRGEHSLTFHAARFEHVATPSRPLEGIVTDQDTGAPLPGVKVEGAVVNDEGATFAPGVGPTTGPDGRYRLLGLGQSSRYRLFLKPGSDRPYIPASVEVESSSSGASWCRVGSPTRRPGSRSSGP
jgi:RNA polymerase sigma factor (sigma-70 family)